MFAASFQPRAHAYYISSIRLINVIQSGSQIYITWMKCWNYSHRRFCVLHHLISGFCNECITLCVCLVFCESVCAHGFFRLCMHKFYFTDDNAIFFHFVSDGVFFVLHVRVIRMSISKQQQLQTLHAIDLVASRASRMRLKIFLISRLVFSWAFEQVFNAKNIEKVFHISKQKPMRFRFVCFFLMHNFSIPSSHTPFPIVV